MKDHGHDPYQNQKIEYRNNDLAVGKSICRCDRRARIGGIESSADRSALVARAGCRTIYEIHFFASVEAMRLCALSITFFYFYIKLSSSCTRKSEHLHPGIRHGAG
jgi:hypothetical protein